MMVLPVEEGRLLHGGRISLTTSPLFSACERATRTPVFFNSVNSPVIGWPPFNL
ncbi:hypothetical protein [Paludisphaera borealis]|uniref:Uncharacterized protein n=1 Tax=Paludisphaera borealis TaxID=1387353 RepID=A0A1U7CL75_9BACT|nr:hypothetical protein [Paludisphaera borealis]APW59658.1 hypothetical protein BSF38_01087 [Paludisphaera borealis]